MDPFAQSVLHGVVGGASALLAALSLRHSWRARRSGAALSEGLPPIELSSTSGEDPSLASSKQKSRWVGVTGEVSCEAPLHSYNKDACCVIEEVTSTTTLRLNGEYSDTRTTVKARSIRDTAFSLAPVDGSGSARVHIPRDALRRAYLHNYDALQDLSPGGMIRMPLSDPWYVVLYKLLMGVMDEESVAYQNILPVGVSATVMGLLEVDSSGRITLGLHPLYGMILFRGDASRLMATFSSRARWWGLGAALAGSVAAWQLWKCVLFAFPTTKPLRRLFADFVAHIGWRIPEWQALENPTVELFEQFGAAPGYEQYAQRQSSGAAGSGRRRHNQMSSSSSDFVGGVHRLDISARDEASACCICQDRQKIAVLVPCGHICTCLTCAHRLADDADPSKRRCPLCRAPFAGRDVVRVFSG